MRGGEEKQQAESDRVAQWEERLSTKQEAGGLSPFAVTWVVVQRVARWILAPEAQVRALPTQFRVLSPES